MSQGVFLLLVFIAWLIWAVLMLYFYSGWRERSMEKQRRNFLCTVFGHRWALRIKKHRKTYYYVCTRCKVRSDEAVLR